MGVSLQNQIQEKVYKTTLHISRRGEKMNENELSREYPTPKASIIVFFVSLILVVIIGSILQYYIFLPGLYVTEWLLILGPPLVLLWKNKVDFKKSLKLLYTRC